MKLANPIDLVRKAQEGGYAVAAMNTNGGTYDITRAMLEAAEATRSPLIVQVYYPNAEYRGLPFCARLVETLVEDLKITVPVALHLDHGKSIEAVTEAMDAGFTGVMIDASHHPLDENIAIVRKVIGLARPRGVSVEAEVGCVAGNEPAKKPQVGRVPIPERPASAPARTLPAEAKRLVAETGVDMLAVAIGSMHGVFRKQDDFDWDLLARIRREVDVPLVMHGTSGIGLEDLTRLARLGMEKINFGEPFRYNYIRYFTELADTMEHQWHAWRIMRGVKDRLREDMEEILRALGSEGKA